MSLIGKIDHSLTRRESQVLSGYAEGLNRQAIGDRLGILATTVSQHMTTVRCKLEVETNEAAIAWWRSQ